jgi:hypothetical protein
LDLQEKAGTHRGFITVTDLHDHTLFTSIAPNELATYCEQKKEIGHPVCAAQMP